MTNNIKKLNDLLEKIKNTLDDVINKAIDSLHRKLRKEKTND